MLVIPITGFCVFFWSIDEYEDYWVIWTILFTVFIVANVFVIYNIVVRLKKVGESRLIQLADYVQSNSGTTIFVKNRKFGVFKMWGKFKVLIPPEYDDMVWKEYKKILQVKKNGAQYLIDMNNHRLN